MSILIAGLVVFLGLHSLRIVAEDWRSRMLIQLGERAWKGWYSLVSIIGFALICWGYGLARQQPVVLWVPPIGMRHMAAGLMLLSMVLMAAVYVPGNSIKAKLHHPMILSVKVWATAHLLANGNLADVLLFGSFLVWAVLCFIAARKRDRASAVTKAAGSLKATFVAIFAGVLLYGVFAVYLHPWLIKVSVFGVA